MGKRTKLDQELSKCIPLNMVLRGKLQNTAIEEIKDILPDFV